MLNGLDLFSGIGGLTLALGEWVRPVAYCEIEPFAAAVLFSRMLDGSIPTAPIFPDVTKLGKGMLPNIDIIYGGFPCQPYSTAARGRNQCDTLKGQFIRIISEARPQLFFAENVSATAFDGFQVKGYEIEVLQLDAAAVGAPHSRSRFWLLGYANSNGKPTLSKHEQVAGVQKAPKTIWNEARAEDVRMVDGIQFRMERLKSLGNSVVPQCAKEAFKILMGLGESPAAR